MRIRRGIAAAGITIASLGVSFATAGAAAAVTPTQPTVSGTITGPHTFTFPVTSGQVVVVGETLHPNAPGYFANVPVTNVATANGVTTITTGYTFLPLNRKGVTTTFTVVPPVP
jgi:acyl-coenzyme A thioesterase PaaI-like protein